MNAENKVIPFIYDESPVRVILDEAGEPWWVAKDICRILEHTNPTMATEYLDDDEKGVSKVYTPGGEQEMVIISESGLYTLLIRSNKLQAKPFRRWVTHEVLPSIRKTGAYNAPTNNPPPSAAGDIYLIFDKMLTVLDRMVTMLSNIEARHAAPNKSTNQTKSPRVNYYDYGSPTEHGKPTPAPPLTYAGLQAAWRMEGIAPEIREFILQCISLNRKARTQLYEIYCAYLAWCAKANFIAVGRNTFYHTLHQAFAGYCWIRPKSSKLYISGIVLKR